MKVRNGHRPRLLATQAGDVELKIPKLRKGSFLPSLLEPRRRIVLTILLIRYRDFLTSRRQPPCQAPQPRPPPRGSRSGRSRLAGACLAAAAAVAAVAAAAPAAAQTDTPDAGDVRIVARKLADGRVEFGLQTRNSDGDTWGQRQLPTRRFFPTTATVGRWLNSTPVNLDGDATVRIVARKLADGRVEFGLQTRNSDGAWGERQLPTRRFFPTTAAEGRWLASTPLTVATPAGSAGAGQQRTYTAIAAGGSPGWTYDGEPRGGQTCGLRTDGTAVCWDSSGEVIDDGEDTPPDGTLTAITAGRRHTCGLRTDGTAVCWGEAGQSTPYGYEHDGRTMPPDGTFTAIAAGGTHSCAIRTDGTAVCWGAAGRYTVNGYEHHEQTTPPDGTFTAIAAGGTHSCAIRTDGTAVCWGRITNSPDGTFTAITAGSEHICALRTDGTAVCWGDFEGYEVGGPVGDGDHGWRPHGIWAPTGRFTAISSLGHGACGLRTDGSAVCWGVGYDVHVEEADAPSGTFTAITGGLAYACGLRSDGTATCWDGEQVVPRVLRTPS